MGDYSLNDLNLEIVTVEEMLYIYDSWNARCVISNGHITEITAN